MFLQDKTTVIYCRQLQLHNTNPDEVRICSQQHWAENSHLQNILNILKWCHSEETQDLSSLCLWRYKETAIHPHVSQVPRYQATFFWMLS